VNIEGDFDRLEALLARFAFALTPRERRGLAVKIGQAVRRNNAARIAKNIQPDGSAMEARIPRPKGGKKGPMFRGLRMTRNLKNRASPDGVEISFPGRISRVAEINHFGEVAAVGRTKDGRTIRTRYAERQLLGVGNDDEEQILAAIEKHLGAAG
jgi:phage virion morphogenesis protein